MRPHGGGGVGGKNFVTPKTWSSRDARRPGVAFLLDIGEVKILQLHNWCPLITITIYSLQLDPVGITHANAGQGRI